MSVLHLHGTVLPDGTERDVFVVDGRISFDPHPAATTILAGGYLVPGLVDAHAHLALASPRAGGTPDEQVRASAEAQLAAGVLAIREPGSPHYASRNLGPGLPRTVTGGRFLARAGRYFPGLAREVEPGGLPAAAAEEATASGHWAKIIADFPTPGGRIVPMYPPVALAEAASRVHALGFKITAHATCPDAIEACLVAGFDAIEHGTEVRPDHLTAMAAQDTVLVPTLLIRDEVIAAVTGMGGDADSIRRLLDAQPALVKQAVDAGVTVLAGTDAGMVPHGLVGREIGRLVAAGLTPDQALGAGSWHARTYLGLPGIEAGAPADIVAYADDPRSDIEVLTRPKIVILDGRLVTGPGGQSSM